MIARSITAAGFAAIVSCSKPAGPHPAPAVVLDGGAPRFGLGRRAAPAEIHAAAREVLPDGTGLPVGHGTSDQGAAIFATRCAGCHGAQGEGGSALALVRGGPVDGSQTAYGYRVGRAPPGQRQPTFVDFYPYATTLFDYTRRAMPWGAPGSLTDDETYSLVAWMLARNGLLSENAVLDGESLRRIKMPARDRFVLPETP
jgi:cytochrome c